jgi:hypothetical protein
MSALGPVTTAAAGPPCLRCGVANRLGARFCRNCGAELVDQQRRDPVPLAVSTGGARAARSLSGLAAAGRARLRRTSRRTQVLVGAGLVLLLVLVCGGYVVIENVFYSPDGPVRQVFAALEAKDTAGLRGYMDCDPLCQPGALAVGYQPPTHLQIVGVRYGAAANDDPTRRPDKGDATVLVRYQLGGVTYDDAVGVYRLNSGLLRPWGISQPPGSWLDVVSTSLDTAKVAGATVHTIAQLPPGDTRTSGEAWAPPGIYTVTGRQSVLWGSPPVQVLIAGSSTGRKEVKLDLAVKPTVVDEVNRQVRTRIDDCAALRNFYPATDASSIVRDCPFRYDVPYSQTQGVKWTIVDYPRIELNLGDDQTVTVRTTMPGHARVNYSYSFNVTEPRTWSPASATVEIAPAGTVSEDGGKVVWSFP